MNKKILFILRSSPYGSSMAQEGIDTVLAASIFNLPCSVLFMYEGIWQLHAHQQSRGIQRESIPMNCERKNIAAQIESFPLYDINNIYLDERSLQTHGLSTAELILEPTELTEAGIESLLHEHDIVLTY